MARSIVALLLILASLPVLAAEGQAKGGMPQLDVSTFSSQIFWLIIAFITLVWLMQKKALPRVSEILETRQDRMAADLDRAAKLRASAEESLKRYDQVVSEAQASAQRQIREVQERNAAATTRRQATLDAELATRLHDAESRIGKSKSAALGSIADVAAEVAQAAVARLAGIEVSLDEARAGIGRAMGSAAGGGSP